MGDFRFFQPVDIRYGDIDAQRHLNNAVYFTFFEQARCSYLQHLGLWDGKDFDRIGIILAETTCTFKAAITLGTKVRVGVRTIRLGTKSLELVYTIEDEETGQEMASGHSVQVAYDYQTRSSIPIPTRWRQTIVDFEGEEILDQPG